MNTHEYMRRWLLETVQETNILELWRGVNGHERLDPLNDEFTAYTWGVENFARRVDEITNEQLSIDSEWEVLSLKEGPDITHAFEGLKRDIPILEKITVETTFRDFTMGLDAAYRRGSIPPLNMGNLAYAGIPHAIQKALREVKRDMAKFVDASDVYALAGLSKQLAELLQTISGILTQIIRIVMS